ncbi:MAG: hypothetical protein K8J08_09885, partial [Thermoanaerobaculia bacterium]|nr:hypothetical protein [Thermoanaerobaculia bacterium]
MLQPVLGPEKLVEELDLENGEDPFATEVAAYCSGFQRGTDRDGKDGEDGEWTPPAVRALRVHGPDLLEAILAVVEEVEGKLLLLPNQERQTGSGAEFNLTRQLYNHAACSAALLRAAPDSEVRRRRILV